MNNLKNYWLIILTAFAVSLILSINTMAQTEKTNEKSTTTKKEEASKNTANSETKSKNVCENCPSSITSEERQSIGISNNNRVDSAGCGNISFNKDSIPQGFKVDTPPRASTNTPQGTNRGNVISTGPVQSAPVKANEGQKSLSIAEMKSIELPNSAPSKTDSTKPEQPLNENPNQVKEVLGGVLNSKSNNLVRPTYPPMAKAVKASGAINVQVTIDEEGNVISAKVISGHPMLWAVSEKAARESIFSPTFLCGLKVKVTGTIVYNFSAQ